MAAQASRIIAKRSPRAKQPRLAGLCSTATNHPLKERRAAPDNVHMPHGHGVKAAGINADPLHSLRFPFHAEHMNARIAVFSLIDHQEAFPHLGWMPSLVLHNHQGVRINQAACTQRLKTAVKSSMA